jgi:hypothetical protein
LSGQPKIDEPLRRAWGRALQHYEIKGEDYIADPGRLSAEIMQGRPASERLAEIFKMAPVWLLQFTGVAMDARFLQFDLPLLAEPLRWGSNGYEDARRWPLLPDGTMTAGDPIPHADARQLWITVFCKITVAIPDFEDNLLEEHEETHSEHSGLDDLSFALDLDGTPEKEWTRYERRRMRRISEWILDRGTRRSGRH